MFSSVVLWFSPIEEGLHGAHHDGACFAETLHPSPNLFASSLTSVADVQKPRSEKERQFSNFNWSQTIYSEDPSFYLNISTKYWGGWHPSNVRMRWWVVRLLRRWWGWKCKCLTGGQQLASSDSRCHCLCPPKHKLSRLPFKPYFTALHCIAIQGGRSCATVPPAKGKGLFQKEVPSTYFVMI